MQPSRSRLVPTKFPCKKLELDMTLLLLLGYEWPSGLSEGHGGPVQVKKGGGEKEEVENSMAGVCKHIYKQLVFNYLFANMFFISWELKTAP